MVQVMSTHEADRYRPILLALSKAGHRVFRNNVGVARYPTATVVYGLAPGSSDLIGWTNTGAFLAIEVKTERGRLTDKQHAFLTAVRAAGGCGDCARTPDDAMEAIAAWATGAPRPLPAPKRASPRCPRGGDHGPSPAS
ncbi:MAG: hypothetical protein EBS23_05895 [Betaproteobacteria bacterium]|nr:hypothetical protein [Betaproteobacteria bacterium]